MAIDGKYTYAEQVRVLDAPEGYVVQTWRKPQLRWSNFEGPIYLKAVAEERAKRIAKSRGAIFVGFEE